MKRALVVLAVTCALPAHANIWQNAIDQGAPDAARDLYNSEMRQADEHVRIANAESGSRSQMKEQLRLAVQAYTRAAAASPNKAEPYFRIGQVLYSFHLENCFENASFGLRLSPLRDCTDTSKIDAAIARQTVAAWNEAEKRAPLDPRFSADEGSSLLFTRALLNTKLATKSTWESAAEDYIRYLERSDGRGGGTESAWANLAETYMMLGRLEDSIDAYREALRSGSDISTRYGYAVALDRSERGVAARDLILAQGEEAVLAFKRRIENDLTFFVPKGEVFYYYALIHEAHGKIENAIEYWRMYISSGAHPQYQPRAKEHLNALLVKQRARPVPPRDWLWDAR